MLGVLHPCKEWYSFALVGVVLSICQAEAPLHPYLLLAHVFWRLLLLCLLWLAVGSCIHVLRSRLWRRPKQVSSHACRRTSHDPAVQFNCVFSLRFLFPFLPRESLSRGSRRRLWLRTGITSTHGQAFISVSLCPSFNSKSFQRRNKDICFLK